MRRADLHSISKQQYDLIVVGCGVTGAAIARDAALRGLKVLAVEKEDIASGTSSRSSKLIHGGLRYLETYQFGLVAESVREREMALRVAPHLTKVQPFLYMFYDDAPDKKWLLNLGLTFYDVVSGSWAKRRHRMLSRNQVLERQPQFRQEGLNGAALFFDVSTDDARVTIDTIKSACEQGAEVINHCEVVGLTFDDKRCNGVQVKDRLTGETGVVQGHYVVNASGPWSDNILRFEDGNSKVLRPTKGVHIVLRKSDFPLHSAVFTRSPDDGRVVWPIPSMQDDRVFIGTTDTTYEGDLDNVCPDKQDIDYLLNVANHLMPTARLEPKHVVGSWAGLRPLIAPKDDLNNSKTPREHQIMVSDSGVLSIVGGKLTSHRVMAKQVIDRVIREDGYKYLSPSLLPHTAHKVVLSGARPIGQGGYSHNQVVAKLVECQVPMELARAWAGRFGSNALKVAEIYRADPANQVRLSERGLTVAELDYCVNYEVASQLADLLIRRTSEFFWDKQGGLAQIKAIAAEMQQRLGWSDEQTAQQIERYQRLVEQHRPVVDAIEKATTEDAEVVV